MANNINLLPWHYVVIVGIYWVSFWRQFSELISAWWSSHEASQGLIIIPVSLILLCYHYGKRASSGLNTRWLGLLIFFIASTAIVIGTLVSVQLLQHAGLIVGTMSLYYALYGVRSEESVFPYFFAAIALPFWHIVNPLFQKLSYLAAAYFFSLTTIPHYSNNLSIEFASGVFVVDPGCSGIRYLLSGLTISALYVYLYVDKWNARFIGVSALLVMALIGNWIRIIAIILIGYFSEMKNPIVNDHDNFGWVLFGVILLFWFYIMNRSFFSGANDN